MEYTMARLGLLSVLLLASTVAVPAVRTSFGTVNGNALTGVNEYVGVPYAAPPKRFLPPTPWAAQYPAAGLDATAVGDVCFQQTATGKVLGSEDCLFLSECLCEGWGCGVGGMGGRKWRRWSTVSWRQWKSAS